MSGDDSGFYALNASLFALPALAAYFAWQRRIGLRVIGVVALLFILGAVAANAYPLPHDSQTIVLTAIHLPLALWLVVGVAYVGGDWRSDQSYDRGPPPGYYDQAPSWRERDDWQAPQAYNDHSPPPGYYDQAPPSGYDDRGPPPGYDDRSEPRGYGGY